MRRLRSREKGGITRTGTLSGNQRNWVFHRAILQLDCAQLRAAIWRRFSWASDPLTSSGCLLHAVAIEAPRPAHPAAADRQRHLRLLVNQDAAPNSPPRACEPSGSAQSCRRCPWEMHSSLRQIQGGESRPRRALYVHHQGRLVRLREVHPEGSRQRKPTGGAQEVPRGIPAPPDSGFPTSGSRPRSPGGPRARHGTAPRVPGSDTRRSCGRASKSSSTSALLVSTGRSARAGGFSGVRERGLRS